MTATKPNPTNHISRLLGSYELVNAAFEVARHHHNVSESRKEFAERSQRLLEKTTLQAMKAGFNNFDDTDQKLQRLMEDQRAFQSAANHFVRLMVSATERWASLLTLVPNLPTDPDGVCRVWFLATSSEVPALDRREAVVCGPRDWAELVQSAVEMVQPHKYFITAH